MNKIDFSELDVEFIRQEPLWGSFLDALQEFYTDQVRNPLQQLREIRDLKATTSLVFIKQALSDMGITIPPDMIVNPERLYNSVYMIPLLHRVTGLESAYRAISYILGRRVRVYDLYTEDYVSFYEEPYGALRIDGGTWYKATHINLEMQKVGSDSNIHLPSGTTLKDRFLSAFFTLAPINIVIDQFFFSIEVENREDFCIQGVVYRQPVRRLICDVDYSLDTAVFAIEGPDEVENGSLADYRLMANHQEFVSTEWSSSDNAHVQIKDGHVSFSGFEQDSLVTLTAVIRGQTVTKNVTVKMGMIDVRMLEIIGPDTILSTTSGDYYVVAYHSEGSTEINADIKVVSPYAYFSGNTLHGRNLLGDQTVGITVSIKIGGIKYSASKLVKLKYVDPNVYLVGLNISGEDRLKEGSAHQFYSTAFFSDGSSTDVLSLWDATSPAVVIDNGLASTTLVNGETAVQLSAQYGFRNQVITAVHDVVVYPAFLTLASLTIMGPTQVEELVKATYSCLAVMSDGSSTIVTPKWFTTEFSISENGVLDTGIVKDMLDVEIRATYNGITQKLNITVARPAVALQSLLVQGQGSIREGSINTYMAYAQYSNGNVLPIKPEWSLAQEYDWATFVDGELLVESPQESTVAVKATYALNGATYVQTKTVVCISASNNITGLLITGANEVDALERIILTATATYEDGSFQTVHPQWEVYTEDSNATFVAADIAGYGVVTGRNVDEDMRVIVRATYFQETAEYPITVRYVAQKGPDVPVSSRIIGNPVIYSTQVASFAQAILFKQCTSELLVSSDWTVDNPNIVVDENGFVTCKLNADMTFTISATWSCGGYTVVDSLVVTVIPVDALYIGLGITGNDVISIGVKEAYAAEAYTDETGIIVGKGVPVNAEWTVLSDSLNIQVFPSGQLRLTGAVVNQTITLAARYAFENTAVEGTTTIRVLGSGPIYCTGNALDVNISTLFSKGIMIIEEAFRDDFTGYGFMLVPTVFGTVHFFDVETGVEGGWVGVDGSPTPTIHKEMQGGIEVSWYVYRTIGHAMGQKSYRITYS
jgi:hypothetical protein